MRGKINTSSQRTGVRVHITNFEGKTDEQIKEYAQKVIDRSGWARAYKVFSLERAFRDDTTIIAHAMVP